MTTTLTASVDGSPTAPAVGEPSALPDGGRRSRRLAGGSRRARSRMPRLWVRGDRAATPRRARPLSPTWLYLRSMLTAVTLLALGFVGMLTLGSQLQNGRDQQVLYNTFREELATAVAPVSAVTDEGTALASGAPIALLAIPALGLDAVVVEGTSSGDTMLGPGHRRDTVFPGQQGVSVIFGRQAAFGGAFAGIGGLTPGTEITTTTGQGTATYRVERVRRAGDPNPPELAAGAARLILVSAEGTDYLPDSVVRVDAALVSTSVDGVDVATTPFGAGDRVISAGQLPAAELPMGSDTSQVFSLVLWAEAFLVAVLAFTWARERWGRWQAWTVGVPVLVGVGWAVSNQISLLLPNLL